MTRGLVFLYAFGFFPCVCFCLVLSHSDEEYLDYADLILEGRVETDDGEYLIEIDRVLKGSFEKKSLKVPMGTFGKTKSPEADPTIFSNSFCYPGQKYFLLKKINENLYTYMAYSTACFSGKIKESTYRLSEIEAFQKLIESNEFSKYSKNPKLVNFFKIKNKYSNSLKLIQDKKLLKAVVDAYKIFISNESFDTIQGESLELRAIAELMYLYSECKGKDIDFEIEVIRQKFLKILKNLDLPSVIKRASSSPSTLESWLGLKGKRLPEQELAEMTTYMPIFERVFNIESRLGFSSDAILDLETYGKLLKSL